MPNQWIAELRAVAELADRLNALEQEGYEVQHLTLVDGGNSALNVSQSKLVRFAVIARRPAGGGP
jgi:hypothetical protein